ncbi:hypothetical protein VNI00_002504 [Paramarasmius palmivorus]|uniref:Uncharacterized protein n=1 Tax=Paramarasmius palmivorus TaxID=297713 RepID=A0AAW0DYQ3_9AGAR
MANPRKTEQRNHEGCEVPAAEDHAYEDVMTRLQRLKINIVKDALDLRAEIGSVRSDLELLRTPNTSASGDDATDYRTGDPRRRRMMTDFRVAMNERLTITQDVEILSVYSIPDVAVTPEEVSSYTHSDGPAPDIEQDDFLRVYWDKLECSWNQELCEQMVEYFLRRNQSLYCAEEDKEFCRGFFWQRLRTLQKVIQWHRPKQGEAVEDLRHRLSSTQVKQGRKKRQRTRRVALWNKRKNTAQRRSEIGNLEQKSTWHTIGDIVTQLGPDGMSSDESDGEGRGTCKVRAKIWRSNDITDLLQYVDDSGRKTTIYGNAAPVNNRKAYRRVRSLSNPTSDRGTVPGLPANFYDPEWLRSLPPVERTALLTQAEATLPSRVSI